jgi:hypothetical protein
MRCGYCEAAVERNEWFCPNCKRSQPRRPGLSGLAAGWLGAGLAAGVLAVLVLAAQARSTVAGGGSARPSPGPPADSPVATAAFRR